MELSYVEFFFFSPSYFWESGGGIFFSEIRGAFGWGSHFFGGDVFFSPRFPRFLRDFGGDVIFLRDFSEISGGP